MSQYAEIETNSKLKGAGYGIAIRDGSARKKRAVFFNRQKKDKVVTERRVATKLDEVLLFLAPHKSDIKGIVVESTYNWCCPHR